MKFILLSVGRPKGALADAIAEYETRASHYWPIEAIEVREEGARGLSPEIVMAREGERLLEKVGPARLVVCDVGGKAMTSEAIAAWLQRAREDARDVAMVIGGAFGLSPSLRARAELKLSLSSFTLPHELARLVLAEQLYRAGTIGRGEPYHK